MALRTLKAEVTLELTSPLLGTVAKNPELYKDFIATKIPETTPDPAGTSTPEEELQHVEKLEEKGWTGFLKDSETGELFIYSYMIKGFLKNAGNLLKKQADIKNLRAKINDALWVTPRKIYLGKSEPDGVYERPIRVTTPQGQRVALIRSDLLKEGLRISFTLNWLEGSEISADLLETLFQYGEACGLGQFRTSNAFGQFTVISFIVVA